MRVLITGGAGYIGIELAYRLAALNETTEVVIYDSLSRSSANVFTGLRKFPAGKVSFVEADLLDSPSLLARIKNADCLFHLAAVVPAANHAQSPHFFEQINNWGAGVLVDAIERSARDLRVIYLSSFEVLPYGVVDPLSELTTPSNLYGLSKLRGERHFYRLRDATNCEVSIVRTPTVFGYSKNLRVDLSINRLVFDAYFKNKVMVRGEDEINCYVPMTSLIDSLIKKLKRKETLKSKKNLKNKRINLLLNQTKTSKSQI